MTANSMAMYNNHAINKIKKHLNDSVWNTIAWRNKTIQRRPIICLIIVLPQISAWLEVNILLMDLKDKM